MHREAPPDCDPGGRVRVRMRMREYGQRTTSAPELIYYAEESKRAVCSREANHAKCGSVRFLPCLQGAALCLCADVLALMRRFRADASIEPKPRTASRSPADRVASAGAHSDTQLMRVNVEPGRCQTRYHWVRRKAVFEN